MMGGLVVALCLWGIYALTGNAVVKAALIVWLVFVALVWLAAIIWAD